ncbi:MAG: chemotaxis protein CheW [Desulfobacterales bacterium]|nr:chemotaxis protein CheW [Desulfobacterales bacterium]
MGNHQENVGGGSYVTIFAAPPLQNMEVAVYFLIGSSQVEEILDETPLLPVPMAPGYLDGITLWRGKVLPVLTLEKRLGFQPAAPRGDRRMLVLRAVHLGSGGPRGLTGALRTTSDIRNIPPPYRCTPLSPRDCVPAPRLVRGVYAWEKGLLVAPDMGMILSGE